MINNLKIQSKQQGRYEDWYDIDGGGSNNIAQINEQLNNTEEQIEKVSLIFH